MRGNSFRTALILKSLLPYAARELVRHPKKLSALRQYWADYVGRFDKIAALLGVDRQRVEAVFYELECQEPLFRQINGLRSTGMHPWVYYAVVRLMQPQLVVETGVMEGFSSRFILLAMAKNGKGALHSIDLPNQDVELEPGGTRQRDFLGGGKPTGWLVPNDLRDRWHLHLGDSKVLLPQVLATLKSVDIFIHDSLHSYEHMMFEFRAAWPYIRKDGILFSDDVDYNNAFADFTAEIETQPTMFNYRVGAVPRRA